MQPTDPSDESQYSVVPENGHFELVSPSGRRIMSCKDAGSAEHYALMLNEAYLAGFKAASRRHRQVTADQERT